MTPAAAILQWVRDEPGIRPSAIIDRAGERGVKPWDAREAIWSLLDTGDITLSADRRLNEGREG